VLDAGGTREIALRFAAHDADRGESIADRELQQRHSDTAARTICCDAVRLAHARFVQQRTRELIVWETHCIARRDSLGEREYR
jgi:hypothetical protein